MYKTSIEKTQFGNRYGGWR